jgi:(E)-4-hydroxy-3-methylbut-2-enyl-diphosphate synthase
MKNSHRKTREVLVGNIGIGGDNPVRVQTMTNTDTLDIDASVAQVLECIEAGAELVRLTTQTPKHAKALGEIKKKLEKQGCTVPLIADIHFLPEAAFEALKHADKVRLNPGNFAKPGEDIEESLIPFIEAAKKADKPIRIGANHGSLSNRILEKYGDTPEGMVESAMEYLRIFQKHDYNKIVVAMKASSPLVMIEANRLLVKKMDEENMDYPLHLGVTEAGNADDGRVKSTVGIGTLLMEGIGDTIRVSLTESPAKEVPVCYSILQATGRRITKTEFVSCPSCGRTLFDIEKTVNKIKPRMSHLKGVKIAIMGCVVNGLGEMGDADFGYVGGKPGMINLYQNKELIKADVPEEQAVDELEKLIKESGKWTEMK